MPERVRMERTKPKSKSMTLASARMKLFGEPQLLEGEDAAAYDELLARIRAAVKPVDIVEEMFIADVMSLEWEVLRWRRLKLGLIRARVLEALKAFLVEKLDYDLFRDDFQDNLADDQKKGSAQTLAHKCAQNEPEAVDEVKRVLAGIDLDFDQFLDDVQAEKAEELLQEYAQRSPEAVTLVNECLAGAGVSVDSLAADALGEQFGYIERIDHLTTIAENRRNAALREIDRPRAVLGETGRRAGQEVEEVEEGEFKVIETTPAKGKNAA